MNTRQRLALLIAILTSFIPFSAESMITVLLPAIEHEMGGGLSLQQWIANGYMLTLGSFILISGSLSDIFGRLKILRYGLIGFGSASLLCAIAPNSETLITARLLQGAAGALLLPSSLALIVEFISGKNFSKAIGSRTAWTSIAFVIGPLLAGIFADSFNWRLAFVASFIPVIATFWLTKYLPQDQVEGRRRQVDIVGSLLCMAALGGIVFALTEHVRFGWNHPLIVGLFVIGWLMLGAFIWYEARHPHPMLPLALFTKRNFTIGNIATFTVYGGLTTWGFIMALFLQQVAGYGALLSGLATLPVTFIMFFGSSRVGSLSQRFGPRWFMAVGSLMAAIGIAWLALRMNPAVSYVSDILPGMMLFGLGVTLMATPLTATVLSVVPRARSGIASAVNNAVVSIAGLLTIAVIGIALTAQFSSTITKGVAENDVSIQTRQALEEVKDGTPRAEVPSGVAANDVDTSHRILQDASAQSFRMGMFLIAALVAAGGIISMIGIRRQPLVQDEEIPVLPTRP